jgi:hypothetical protein
MKYAAEMGSGAACPKSHGGVSKYYMYETEYDTYIKHELN